MAIDACLEDESIAAALEGRLSEAEREQVQVHLESCPTCRELVSETAATIASSSAPGGDADSVALTPGTALGRYVVEDLIGVGAMGAVYRAEDPLLQRAVALKVLRSDRALPEATARLVREARALGSLSHPNVCGVFDISEDPDRVFIAMELVEGPTLTRWLSKPRSWQDVLRVFTGVARGLAAVHDAGIVHRDFKPDNVLMDAEDRPKVTDFGLAQVRTDVPEDDAPVFDGDAEPVMALSRTGEFIGTPAYASPEQLRGEAVDGRADQFSFCVVLYEALYGRRPFAATTIGELRSAIEREAIDEPPRPDDVPRSVWSCLQRGLRSRPQARYASMHALVDALRAASGHSNQRKRGLFGGLALAAVGAVVAAVALWPTEEVASSQSSSGSVLELTGGCPVPGQTSDRMFSAVELETDMSDPRAYELDWASSRTAPQLRDGALRFGPHPLTPLWYDNYSPVSTRREFGDAMVCVHAELPYNDTAVNTFEVQARVDLDRGYSYGVVLGLSGDSNLAVLRTKLGPTNEWDVHSAAVLNWYRPLDRRTEFHFLLFTEGQRIVGEIYHAPTGETQTLTADYPALNERGVIALLGWRLADEAIVRSVHVGQPSEDALHRLSSALSLPSQ